MPRHQCAEVEHFDVSNVIYQFSHGAVSYTLNGENVNVMLEFYLIYSQQFTKTAYFVIFTISTASVVYKTLSSQRNWRHNITSS